jgi:hypothetical protein
LGRYIKDFVFKINETGPMKERNAIIR